MGRTFSGGDFIPNDTVIGCPDPMGDTTDCSTCVVVTGPNMGGKSTLMRQVGLIVILAQLVRFLSMERCSVLLLNLIEGITYCLQFKM